MTSDNNALVQDVVRAVMRAPAHERAQRLRDLCGTDERLYARALTHIDASVPDWWNAAADDEAASSTTDIHDFGSGDRIGSYRVLRTLGEGGMGIVVLAERDEEDFKKRVAIKLVRRGLLSRQVRGRLKIERQILATLDHANIAKLLDGGTAEDGTPYIVMEYVEGVPIDAYCDENRLSVEQRLRLFRKVCGAVHYAHQNLVIHRDLKPSNILVTADGTPKLLDFGIAKLIDERQAMHTLAVTQADIRLLTPDHASPEQIQGLSITTASDIYVLGVLLYELLTGVRPFEVNTARLSELEDAICNRPPTAPSSALIRARGEASGSIGVIASARATTPARLKRSIHGDLDNIVLMAMRKEPERRYASVEQLSTDVERFLENLPVIARADTWMYRAGKFLRRHTLGAALSGALVLSLIAFAITSYVQTGRIARQRDLAAAERTTAERQRERAEQVSSFLVDLFKVSDPSEARGNDIRAREILDRGAQRIDRELQDQPDVKATLLGTMGSVYFGLGLVPTAEDALRKSLDLRLQLYGPDNPQVASTMAQLAAVLMEKGNLDESQRLYRTALGINTKTYGESSDQVARNLLGLGETLKAGGDFTGAEASLSKSLQLFEKNKRASEPVVADVLSNLALIAMERGAHREARDLLQRAVDIDRARRGEDHPAFAVHLHNLAVADQALGDFADAASEYERSLVLYQHIYGQKHLETISATTNYARFLGESGRFAEANEMYKKVIEANRSVRGARHSSVGYALSARANMNLFMNVPRQAEQLAREALSIYADTLAPDHPQVGAASLILGEALVDEKRTTEGKELLLKAIDIIRKQLPDDSVPVAVARSALGHAYAQLGDHSQGEMLLKVNYEILARGKQSTIYSRRTAAWLAELYLSQRREDLAKPLLEAAHPPPAAH